MNNEIKTTESGISGNGGDPMTEQGGCEGRSAAENEILKVITDADVAAHKRRQLVLNRLGLVMTIAGFTPVFLMGISPDVQIIPLWAVLFLALIIPGLIFRSVQKAESDWAKISVSDRLALIESHRTVDKHVAQILRPILSDQGYIAAKQLRVARQISEREANRLSEQTVNERWLAKDGLKDEHIPLEGSQLSQRF